jgi:hypothetical protein
MRGLYRRFHALSRREDLLAGHAGNDCSFVAPMSSREIRDLQFELLELNLIFSRLFIAKCRVGATRRKGCKQAVHCAAHDHGMDAPQSGI